MSSRGHTCGVAAPGPRVGGLPRLSDQAEGEHEIPDLRQAEFTPRDIHMKDERVKLVFAIKLAIDNPEGLLKPGMPVDARIRWNPLALWGDGSG